MEELQIKRRWSLAPFEIWIGVVAFYAGITHFTGPTSGNAVLVQRAFPWVVELWSILYGIGGLAILVGLWRNSPAVEGFGLCLLCSGIIVAFLATVYVGHIPLLPAVVTQIGIAAACCARLRELSQLSKRGVNSG